LHDLGGSRGLLDLKSRNLAVHNPELTFATPVMRSRRRADGPAPARSGRSFWRACGPRPRRPESGCSMSMSPGRASSM
jgi:hypothetical protein